MLATLLFVYVVTARISGVTPYSGIAPIQSTKLTKTVDISEIRSLVSGNRWLVVLATNRDLKERQM